MKSALLLASFAWLAGSGEGHASIAYGSINNFDTVNDTGFEAHGFEIELDDIHSTDVTYTFNWNHYGVPTITEDNSVAAHPKVVVRWASALNANGSWAAFTAIPAGPIAPTQGHQFTNPAVNFGGEHFGTGYRVQPTAVRYHWLIANGANALVSGPPVQVATPTFVYNPPVAAAPAQVQAAIVPPPPPVPDPQQFGKAIWVKEIKTKTHNANKVALRDLVSDDPANPNDKNWRNGEPDEVEMEWRVLQTNHGAADGGPNGELKAAAEDLNNGNEVVTRRYEFFKYVGPVDAETGEAMDTAVGPDGTHGTGSATYAEHFDNASGEWVLVTTDMTTQVVVGDFTGAQMSAVDVDAVVGLIDHLQEGQLNAKYPSRTVVIGGGTPFTATSSGALPNGMSFDPVTGVVSGTPTESGVFSFTVNASDRTTPEKTKAYTLTINDGGGALPHALVDTSVLPAGSGTTIGDGSYAIAASATVTATASPGYDFVNWTDGGVIVSALPNYQFTVDVNHSLVANFTQAVSFTVTTSAMPVIGGTTAGDGSFNNGANVTVTATANAGYAFENWTDGGVLASATASYSFAASMNRTLVANFSAQPPALPTNTSPAVGATVPSLTPTLQSSVFIGADPGAIHAASQWVVRRVLDGVVVFDSGTDTTHLTSITLLTALAYGTGFEWQVRYEDDRAVWSGYSVVTAFLTPQQSLASFANFKGFYTGLAVSDEPHMCGVESLALSATGGLSTSMSLNGKAYAVKGLMKPDGTFNATIRRAGLPSLSLSLVLDTMNGSDQITGTISDSASSASVLLNRSLYSRTAPVAPSLVGSYTMLLPADPAHPEASAPQGTGYGRLSLSTTGAVNMVNVLGDGSIVTRATLLSKALTLSFYGAPYGKGGSSIGWLTMRDVPGVSDLDGILTWNKLPVLKPRATTPYPAGFSLETAVIGSKYVAPSAHARAIALPDKVNNATVAFSGTNLAPPLPAQAITYSVDNVVTTALGSKFTMRVWPATGVFSGKFVPSSASRPVAFAGVLFQKQDSQGHGDAAGQFTLQSQTGAVELDPVP